MNSRLRPTKSRETLGARELPILTSQFWRCTLPGRSPASRAYNVSIS
jgi:hypothetical protein